ncbi:ATP-binding cassette domain-containing protein [Alphaproteobacteria bacterium]|nr:ATP-binding cassette domain-containing protein [Alphaproteobacteria bacterium]
MMLELRNINIHHSKINLIEDLNLIVKENEVWTLKGPSGKGKTTLLKYILGIKEDVFNYNGKIYLDKIEITNTPSIQRDISMIFQNDFLFPNLSVIENLKLVNRLEKNKPQSLLVENNLDYLINRMPSNLSGGELSRILLLRILLLNTKLILLDEPFNGIDKDNKKNIGDFFIKNLINNKKSAILVTHNEDDIYDHKKVIKL